MALFYVLFFLSLVLTTYLFYTNILLKRKVLQSQLLAMQSQMNPHFIFNALNSIKHYVYIKDTLKADFAIDCFSIFLRRFLDYSFNHFITINDEVKLLETYLALENLRSNDCFDSIITIENGLENEIIPTLIIQPFVENAIKHGVLNLGRRGKISIQFFKLEGKIICDIKDDGKGYSYTHSNSKNKNGHIPKGLLLVAKKISILRKLKQAHISYNITKLENEQSSGTLVRLKIK